VRVGVGTPETRATKNRRSRSGSGGEGAERFLFSGFFPAAHRRALALQPPSDFSFPGWQHWSPSAFLMSCRVQQNAQKLAIPSCVINLGHVVGGVGINGPPKWIHAWIGPPDLENDQTLRGGTVSKFCPVPTGLRVTQRQCRQLKRSPSIHRPSLAPSRRVRLCSHYITPHRNPPLPSNLQSTSESQTRWQ